jgi:hypothetical protein
MGGNPHAQMNTQDTSCNTLTRIQVPIVPIPPILPNPPVRRKIRFRISNFEFSP